MWEQKWQENETVIQWLNDCQMKENTDERKNARENLKKRLDIVSRAWGYHNDGNPFAIYSYKDGTELWHE